MLDMMPALDWLLKLTILLAGAYALSLALRRAAAVVRYGVWVAALAALFIGPAVVPWLRVPLPVLPAALSHSTEAAVAGAAELVRAGSLAGPAQARQPDVPLKASIAPFQVAAGVWMATTLALLGRLAWSAARVRYIIARGRQLHDPRWIDLLYETADRLGMDAVPMLFRSDRTRVPLACRFHRPAIVLPASAEEWSDERRSVVLLHELAHVKRRDLAGHTLSRVACAVYWFHPFVWFAAQRLRSESERACDDLVLESGATPSDYAHQLLTMVSELRSDASPPTAMAMAANREFEGRIVAILDPGVPRRPRSRTRGIVPAGVILGLGLVLAVARPTASTAMTPIGQAPRRDAVADLPRDTATLQRLLETDPNTQVRVSVAWSLHERPDAAELLVAALRSDRDASVREMAAWALGQHGDGALLSVLYSHLSAEPAAAVRATTAWAIGQLRGPSTPQLVTLLNDSDANVLRMAVWAIGQNPPPAAPDALLNHLRHPDTGVRVFTAWSLGEIGAPEAVPSLHAALKTEQDPTLRRAIVRALFESQDRSSLLVDAALRSTDPESRARAAQVLAGQKPRPWVWALPLPDPRPLQ